uniref:Tc1-like transposase DDE domain-containing protein n=1 Tax=Lates calcarifer TaxID=8187 RepID=A0A4W6D483_LATCA
MTRSKPISLTTVKRRLRKQDNDHKHSSKLCRSYLDRKDEEGVLRKMDWPPQCPDLSPVELVWDKLDRSVRKVHPTNQQSFIDELKKAWNAIPGTYRKKNLVERMPRTCHAVVKARGGYSEKSQV